MTDKTLWDQMPDYKPASLTLTRNKGVGVRRRSRSKTWRNIGSRRVRMMAKLDQAKVEWIVRERCKGTSSAEIARHMKVSVRWVQKLCRRYQDGCVSFPKPMGRPKRTPPGRRELSVIFSAVTNERRGAMLDSMLPCSTARSCLT